MGETLKYHKTKTVREVDVLKVPDFPFYMKDDVQQGYHSFYKFAPVYWKHEDEKKLAAINVVTVQFQVGIYDDIGDASIVEERFNVDGDEVIHKERFKKMVESMQFITEFDYRKEFFRALSYLHYDEYQS